MDGSKIAELVLAPIATGVVGFVSAALKYRQRIETLEKDFKDYKLVTDKEIADLKKDWKESFDELKKEFTEKLKELKDEVEEIDDTFTRFQRASSADFADASEMQHFIEEQQRQWQQIQRTLGQIEGLANRVLGADQQTHHLPPTVPRPTRR